MESEAINKTVGYVLIFVGILIIIYSAWNVYNVFTGHGQPYDLFSLKSVSVDLGKVTGQTGNANLNQELIGSDVFNKPLNYTAYVILMGFLSTVGFRIATLGVYLARTLKVNVKQEKIA